MKISSSLVPKIPIRTFHLRWRCIFNSHAVGMAAAWPYDFKIYFVRNPIPRSAARVFIIILEFIFTPIYEIQISEKKNSWHHSNFIFEGLFSGHEQGYHLLFCSGVYYSKLLFELSKSIVFRIFLKIKNYCTMNKFQHHAVQLYIFRNFFNIFRIKILILGVS